MPPLNSSGGGIFALAISCEIIVTVYLHMRFCIINFAKQIYRHR